MQARWLGWFNTETYRRSGGSNSCVISRERYAHPTRPVSIYFSKARISIRLNAISLTSRKVRDQVRCFYTIMQFLLFHDFDVVVTAWLLIFFVVIELLLLQQDIGDMAYSPCARNLQRWLISEG